MSVFAPTALVPRLGRRDFSSFHRAHPDEYYRSPFSEGGHEAAAARALAPQSMLSRADEVIE